MSAIDELLAMTDEEEAWEVIPRYEVNAMYADDDGPVEVNNKSIGDMSSQISIQGESMSQYVEFVMPRYYDNIDLSEKVLSIHYRLGERVGDNAPVNVYKSQDRIKFGWLIPANATADEGKLAISIWARSLTDTEEYIWKSRTTHYTIERGMTIGEGITEPDENWYLDFVRQMDTKVSEALLYSNRAKQSANEASGSAQSASVSKQEASNSATTAIQKAGEALTSASQASKSATTAISNAELSETYRDGAKDYYERTKGISEGLSGQLVPMGTVAFEDLPPLSEVVAGWMYNISNEFTTTSDFKEGAGRVIPLGSNIYKTTDGYWDVLAGSPVSGIKGSAETTYRSGNVNITPANLGITVVNNTKDEDKNVNHSKTSDSTTKAVQDSNGNVIVDTYASKSEASLSGTATGTNPTIQDSTDAPIIYLKENGYTEQFTTSGKNLCSSNNFTVTAPDSGTAQSNYTYKSIDIHDKIVSNKTYIFSADVKILAGSPSEISIAFMNEALSTGTEIKTGTITNNHVEISISIGNASVYYYLLVYAGKQGSTTGNSIEFSNVMLRESTTDSTYEPYTGGIASPNPDYPQEINGLAKDGAIEVKTYGKNLCDNNNFTITAGTGTAQSNYVFRKINIEGKLKAYKTYTMTADVKILAGSPTGISILFFDEGLINGTEVKTGAITNNHVEVSIKFGSNASKFYYLLIYAGVQGSTEGNSIEFSNVMLRESTTDATYKPYTETTATIPTDAPLYEGDYLEVYADGSGKLVRTMADVVIDGLNVKLTGTDSFRPNGCNYAYLWQDDMSLLNKQVSSSIGIGGISPDIEGVRTSDSNTAISIVLYDERTGVTSEDTTTKRTAKFNTWLQSNPVTVVYELATPQEIELTAEQVAEFKKLRTFEPVTNVLCDGEVEVQYFTNSESGKVLGMIQRQLTSLS